MTRYLLDTTTFSALMREDARVKGRVSGLGAEDRVVICTVVKGEILYGLERLGEGKRGRDLAHKASCLFGAIPCDPLGDEVAVPYARLKRAAEAAGTPLDENDLWIAAAAQATRAVLVSSDSDFERLPGIRTEDWMS